MMGYNVREYTTSQEGSATVEGGMNEADEAVGAWDISLLRRIRLSALGS